MISTKEALLEAASALMRAVVRRCLTGVRYRSNSSEEERTASLVTGSVKEEISSPIPD